ncbi:glycosyltransferase family 4 protein [Dactylosporangium siamense]|nr:glycosyltransferase family 4 protein [Dactylosporangium siamense]
MVTNAVAPDKLGGLERYVRELAAALVRSGVETTVVAKRMSPDHPDVETGDDGVTIVRHDVPDKRRLLFAAQYPWYTRRGVRAAVRQRPGAIVHGHFPVPMLSMIPFRRRSHRPFVYTFHAPVYRELLSERQNTYALPRPVQRSAVSLLRRAEAAVVDRAATVTVLSEYMRRQLALLSPRAADDASLIPGGVDTGWFAPANDVHLPAAGTPMMFTARRLVQRTGVAEVIAAMPAVVARHPGAELAIAGDGHLRPAIEQQIVQLGLTGKVHLLGRISEESLRDRYRTATLTVMPTAELEGFGLTTAESLACGTPVLVTPVGANPELVAGMDPRFVARSAEATALADAILALLDQPGVIDAARCTLPGQRVRRWSWDTVASHYIDLYERHTRNLS